MAPRLRDEAVATLRQATAWRLPPARWDKAAAILEALSIALGAGDAAEFQSAIIELELAGPTRITRIGAAPEDLEPIPPPMHERLNHLIHQLTDGGEEKDG
ncbi:hypothetical protein J5X84_15120 [Streptosporangiaceae bacterium NEAU-GS5]|nr:hypothetical protein [Streptosporangiaceae bacterium NEAU-GS5]